MHGWQFIIVASLTFSVCVGDRCVADLPPEIPVATSALDDIANLGHPRATRGLSVPESEETVKLGQVLSPFATAKLRRQIDEALAIFERDHPPRSESNLASFLLDLDRLRRRLDECRFAEQVRVTIQVVEVPRRSQLYGVSEWNSSLEGYGGSEWNRLILFGPPIRSFEYLQNLFSACRTVKQRRVWDVPVINATTGCPARAFSGDAVAVNQTEAQGSQSVSQLTFGNSLEMTATIFDLNRIRLSSTLELKDLGPRNPWTGIPALIDRGRMEATIDLTSGETAYYIEEVRLKTGETRDLVGAVKAEIVSLTDPYIPEANLYDLLEHTRPTRSGDSDLFESSARPKHD